MTVEEKLTAITEKLAMIDVQKVYDAGYKKGYADGKPKPKITIWIDGFSYEAEEGMTWADWCASTYNTLGLYVSEWGGVTNGVSYVRYFINNSKVNESDIITVENTYVMN